ncbi:hypothetical protein PYW08_011513 [Mythimna loreyi]|uniref:Uncharacterized protein n=1 Tax=Mythimna loreyi TaxID=667449 RepID=A0ACC2QM71_9NEOP|nr:hypothetical protein PYW08_011513 [Mythimna loreyi]
MYNIVPTRSELDNVEIEEALDLIGHGRYDLLLCFTCCTIHLGAVLDMLGYGLVVPAASCDLQLSLEDSGMLTSVSFAGFIMSALFWGYSTDKYGRKKALLISSSVGFIMSSLTSFSTSFYMMLILKFIATSFSTASITLTITFLGECTPKKRRNIYLFIQNACSLAADFVCFGIAYFILPLDFNISLPLLTNYRPWRLMTLLMTVPLGVGSLMICFLHESPKFLANMGETDKALEILTAMYEANNGKGSNYPVKSLIKVDKPDNSISFWDSVVKQIVPIFKPPLLWRSLQIFLLFSICCATNNVFYVWFPTMVNSFFATVSEDTSFCERIIANITPVKFNETCIDTNLMNTIYAGLLFSLFFTILNIVIIPVANWRKTLMICTFALSGLCCIIVDMVRQPVANIVIFIAIQLTAVCIGGVGSYCVDLFPTSYRGLATSLGLMFARFVCLGGVNIVGATITGYCQITFYCWGVFVFSGILAALLLPSEVKANTSKSDKHPKIMVNELFVVSRVLERNNVSNKIDLDNVEIEEALELTGHGRYNILLLFTCCLIHLGAVIDLLGYGLVVPAASCDLQLSLKESGMLTSVSFAGFMFALPWGYSVDKYGRKKALFISSSVGFIMSSLTSFSTSFYMMLILKFLATSFSTASITLTITFLGECTSKGRRSRYVFAQNAADLATDFVCFGLAYFILRLDFNIPVPLLTSYRPWRLMTLLMTVPLGMGSLMTCFLHESPKFLANMGETDKALDVLTAMYEANNGKGSVYPVKSLMKVDRPDRTISFWDSVVQQTVPIFKPPLLWRSLQLFLLFSICCATNNVFFVWFPTMVNSFFTTVSEDTSFCERIVANITPVKFNETCIDTNPLNTIYSGLLFSLFFIILNIVIIPISNWRRTLMISTFVLSGLSCILVDVVRQSVASMILFIGIQLTGICMGSVGSYYVDLFPTSHRGLATSIGMMFARFMCLGGVNIVGATIIDYCRITFYSWAVFVFSGILAALFLPSEAKVDSTGN